MARGNVLFIAALLAVSFGCATARPEPAVNAGHWAEASDIVSTVSKGSKRMYMQVSDSCTSARVCTRHCLACQRQLHSRNGLFPLKSYAAILRKLF